MGQLPAEEEIVRLIMISYQVLLKQFKEGKFAPVYLFFGDERYLQEEFTSRLADSFLGTEAEFGLEKMDGAEQDLEEIIAGLSEGGLFARRRLVVVNNPPYLAPPRKKTAEEEPGEEPEPDSREKREAESLSEYLDIKAPDVPDSIIVFLAPGVDRRRRLFKLIDKKGVVVECAPLKGDTLAAWIRRKVERMGKKIDRAAVERLLLAGDHNLHYLSRELEKYCAYLGEEDDTITADTVDILFSGDLQGNVFKLADALAEGKPATARNILDLLLERREQPLLILFMLARHYRMLLQAYSLLEEGRGGGDLASVLGVQPFVARKLREQTGLYDRRALEEVLLVLQKTDYQIKTGCLEPVQALQLVLSRIDYAQSVVQR